ncbi:hypothetical protein FAZ19_09895 [Sphingobacterium alkalisoli]|uniref:Uncharacterized protein n=1 Tax=Sphingobacterium alkalisoli TaxID=1874115 RepID=A0A4U0H1W8_9SPHI|nr:hypothetical protein [Sphingobacterium alkalisoli]TJY65448.1 hypothetical protein FAZ19_09895 [Sphingobacterium alkalisoli]GGH20403.1 hypothetical protein GCM10011418_25570 [Sphingobacterium alkalisoli]
MMYVSQSIHTPPIKETGTIATGVHSGLEAKIDNMDMKSFSPSLYNVLLIEINTGYDQNLFNADIKKMLVEQLDTRYQDLAYQKLQVLMAATSLDYGQINTLVQHLESTFGTNKRLSTIKSNLKTITYYSSTLPQKVNSFIALGYGGFNEEKYSMLKKELNAVPSDVRKRKSVSNHVAQSLQKLHLHYEGYAEWYRTVMQ